MKGLLKKDLAILFCNKAMLIAAIIVLAAVAFMGSGGGQFIMSYMAIFVPMVINSTISYDDMDNGMEYLMTLPVTRRQYVYSKYVFSAGAGFLCWIFSCVMGTLSNVIHGNQGEPEEWLFLCLISLGLLIFISSLIIPVQLKFGAEKAKIAMLLIMVGVSGVTWFFINIKKVMFPGSMNLLSFLNDNPFVFAGIVLLFVLAVFFISMFVSVRIFEKKEW